MQNFPPHLRQHVRELNPVPVESPHQRALRQRDEFVRRSVANGFSPRAFGLGALPSFESPDQVMSDASGKVVDQILQSSQFHKVLDQVKEQAKQGVIEETKKNAFSLFALTLAGGVIGGVVLPKGVAGLVIAGAISVWAISRIAGVDPTVENLQQMVKDAMAKR